MVNPYAPPAAPPPGNYGAPPPPYAAPMPMPPLIEGDRVTISKWAPWPSACVKCGTPADLKPRVQKYAWFPQWTYLLLFIGLIPAAIIQMVMTKRAALTHAICAPCNSRWTWARVAYVLSILVPVLGGIMIMLIGVAADVGAIIALGGLLLFPGIILFPTLAHFLLVKPRTLQALFIDDHVIKLGGVASPVLDAMRMYGGGR